MDRQKLHLPFLDHIRGLAILLVFFYHCLGPSFGFDHLPWLNWFPNFSTSKLSLFVFFTSYGTAGVAIFFVVSGFCIHLSYAASTKKSWLVFYTRRFFRIYPPYLLALLIFALTFPMYRLQFRSSIDWFQLTSHLLLLHNLNSQTLYGIVPAFWSIAMEVQLYLLYPALLLIVDKVGWKRALLLLLRLELFIRGIIGFGSVVAHFAVPDWISFSPFAFWYSWAIGVLLADAWLKSGPLPFSKISAATWVVLAVASGCIRPLAAFSFLLFALATVTMLATLLSRPNGITIPTIFKPLSILGVWSYSFYLIHQPILALVPYAFTKMGIHSPHAAILFAACTCTLPLIMAVSGIYFKFCELPSIARGKSILQRIPVSN